MVDAPLRVVTKTLAGSAPQLADLLAGCETFLRRFVASSLRRFVASSLRRFVAFQNEHQSTTEALWTAHSHAIDAADTTGYLFTHSAEKRSGKTRNLEALELLLPSPIRASTISPSALFRLLDSERRTLLLDEVDAIFSPKSDREELRGLLNAGYRRGSLAWRIEVRGKSFVPTAFDAFGAKVLAGIGTLPDTIADRCIPIELRRRRREDLVERFRYREAREQAMNCAARSRPGRMRTRSESSPPPVLAFLGLTMTERSRHGNLCARSPNSREGRGPSERERQRKHYTTSGRTPT